MKIAFFHTKDYEMKSFKLANSVQSFQYEIEFFEAPLNLKTAQLCKGFDVVCVFVNDSIDAFLIEALKSNGVSILALRCAGFNHVAITVAKKFGLKIVRVPAYSPYAVAEHAVGLILALNRKLHHAFNRVRESNFSLNGLMGFDLNGKTVGVVGTGKIGQVFCSIMKGFGCSVIAYDPNPSDAMVALGVQYEDLNKLYAMSDIISLHCPLTDETKHLIDEQALQKMKNGVMLINTSRGALVQTAAAIRALKSQKIGYLGLDVYEEESDLFFEDLSLEVLQDDIFARLLTFPNVLITGHQAFFTKEAMGNIAETTLQNIKDIETTGVCQNEV